MTIHVFRETDITPSNFVIDIRNILDDGGPHLLSMGTRTTVIDLTAGQVIMSCRYEDQSGVVQGLTTGGASDLTTIDPGLGSTWYMKHSLIMDKYHPLGDSAAHDSITPFGFNTQGLFQLQFQLFGTAGTAKFSYEAVLEKFDGSPAVVHHP